jgi:hypothetical protein
MKRMKAMALVAVLAMAPVTAWAGHQESPASRPAACAKACKCGKTGDACKCAKSCTSRPAAASACKNGAAGCAKAAN